MTLKHDGYLDRRLFLIPWILNILKMTFPYANQLQTLYLFGINKLRPKKFKVERICDEHFDQLLQDNQLNQNFLGDKKSWALLNVNSLVALSASSSTWLKLFLPGDDENPAVTPNVQNPMKNIRLPKPGEVDDYVEINEESNNILIQCAAVSSNLKDFHLYVTDDVFYNIRQKLSILADSSTFEVMVNVVDEEYQPDLAESAVVAVINNCYDILANDLQDILHEYFLKPKYLRKNDCFSVNLRKYAPQLKYTSTYHHISRISFKVINIAGKKNQYNVGYYVVKNHTSLYLDPPAPGYLIPIVSKYVKLHEKIGYEIPLCPYGLRKQFDQLKSLISPFLFLDVLQAKPIFLLTGAQGSGKKTVVSCISEFFGLNVLDVDCFDFYGAGSSVTEAKLEVLASKARKLAPCLLLLKNVELIGRDRDHNEDVRLVSAFQHHLNEIFKRKSEFPIFVLATTDLKPSELLPSIARIFLQTVTFEVPKAEEAYGILNWFVQEAGMTSFEEELRRISEKVSGYVFADLALLFRRSLQFQRRDKILTESERSVLLQRHFEEGIKIMESAYSDSIGAAKVPTVKWEDVGGLENLKEEIMITLNLPLKHPQLFASGLKRSGILFYGPPGTGKTLMAKAVATECNFNFLSVKGPELMNMYVGQSERNVREVFERARDASPCIIFFDELDSLAPNRGKSGDSGGVTDRVVSQLLAEMDGLHENNRIFVIAATNRPDLVDPALLRPGRFDKMFYVGVCGDDDSKLSVFKALTRKFKLGDDVRFEDLVKNLPGQVTGADIYSVCSNAWLAAARRNIEKIEQGFEISIPVQVTSEDFKLAASQFVPSLTLEDISYYQQLKSLER